jgi:endonuclease YncB( thermonuclease family)
VRVITSSFWRKPAKRLRRFSRKVGVWLALAVGIAAWAALSGLDIDRTVAAIPSNLLWARDVQIVAAFVLMLAAAQLAGLDRALWHWLANVTAFERSRPLRRVWVIDGDTIDDLETGVRYRLANIDSPEIGDAKCFRERERGEQAKWEAVRLVRGAATVAVRRTWRSDQYGRRIAFVSVDGKDLGQLLMDAGLARPWLGRRARWCGRSGGLAKIAAAGAMPHACSTCRAW